MCKLVNLLYFMWFESNWNLFTKSSVTGDFFSCVDKDYISCDPNNIRFLLYNDPNNLDKYDELIYNNISSIKSSPFDPNKRVIILSHGFIQNITSIFPLLVKNAYLESGFNKIANIIVVDWGKLSGSLSPPNEIPVIRQLYLSQLPLYINAAANVDIIGQRIAKFLHYLFVNNKTRPEQIQLVGQSLGAHISGLAGMYFKKYTNESVARITGTDPAAPLFFYWLPDGRLDESDADFVQVIHTNQYEFGWVGNLGDVDFYVNGGGPLQPGCNPLDRTKPFCAHDMATIYFAKSIYTTNITAGCGINVACLLSDHSEVIFGEHCRNSTRGSYYIHIPESLALY